VVLASTLFKHSQIPFLPDFIDPDVKSLAHTFILHTAGKPFQELQCR